MIKQELSRAGLKGKSLPGTKGWLQGAAFLRALENAQTVAFSGAFQGCVLFFNRQSVLGLFLPLSAAAPLGGGVTVVASFAFI